MLNIALLNVYAALLHKKNFKIQDEEGRTHKKHLMAVSTRDTHCFRICHRTHFCSGNSQQNNSFAAKPQKILNKMFPNIFVDYN